MTPRIVALVLVAVLAVATAAAAQGRGNGRGRQPQPAGPGGPARGGGAAAVVPSPVQPSPSYPQFGAWLDDATTAARGVGFASIGASYWRGAGATQTDAPILGVGVGLTDRAQLSATVPFYRASYEGFSGSGLDNVYVSGKVALVDPDAGAGRFGLAAGAVAEILSAGFAGASRVHWAVPLSVEVRGGPVRLYGSTGYFSRGAFFAGGALEWTAPRGTSLTASLSHSASVEGLTVATAAQVPRARLLDAGLSVWQPVSRIASLYVGGSRTFSDSWIDGAVSVGAGLAFRFAGADAVKGSP